MQTRHNTPQKKTQIWISALRNLEDCCQTAKFNGKLQNIAFDACSTWTLLKTLKVAICWYSWRLADKDHNRSCLKTPKILSPLVVAEHARHRNICIYTCNNWRSYSDMEIGRGRKKSGHGRTSSNEAKRPPKKNSNEAKRQNDPNILLCQGFLSFVSNICIHVPDVSLDTYV